MTPYFTLERWKAFQTIAESWLGTPYKHCTMVRGGGADCTLFIGACWKESGILEKVEYSYYPRDWYRHAPDERVLESLHEHFQRHAAPGIQIERLGPDAELMPGDLLTFAVFSPVTNHAAMYWADVERDAGQIMHADPKRGVCIVRHSESFRARQTNVFRIMEE